MRRMFPLLIGAVAATVATASPTPVVCATPNVPARVLRAEEPDTPAMAQQMGIGGIVHVVATLNEESRLTRVQIRSSPSILLNNAALNAARSSSFQTEIRDCRPVASEVIVSMAFSDNRELMPHVETSPRPLFVAHGLAQIALPVSAIVLRVKFSALGATASSAEIADDAAYQRFRAAFAALSRPIVPPVIEYRDVFPAASPGVGYAASRVVAVTVAPDVLLGDLLRAADAAGATSATIAYTANTGTADVGPAVASALRAAERDARAVAGQQRLRLGALADSKTQVHAESTPTPVLLGAPLARGELPVVPRAVTVYVDVVARFAVQP